MAQEVSVRVRLDTGPAQTELRNLEKQGQTAGARVSSRVRGAVAKGLGAVGLGAGVGVGIAALKGSTASGISDVIGESLGGLGKAIEFSLLGELGEQARADAAARSETAQAFGAIAGRTGAIPPGAKSFFDQVRALRGEEEKGRGLFERDAQFRTVSMDKVISTISENIEKLLRQAVGWLADELKEAVFGK